MLSKISPIFDRVCVPVKVALTNQASRYVWVWKMRLNLVLGSKVNFWDELRISFDFVWTASQMSLFWDRNNHRKQEFIVNLKSLRLHPECLTIGHLALERSWRNLKVNLTSLAQKRRHLKGHLTSSDLHLTFDCLTFVSQLDFLRKHFFRLWRKQRKPWNGSPKQYYNKTP
jgi:hypothetical protein